MPLAHELGTLLDDFTLEVNFHFADDLVAHRNAARIERVRVGRIGRARDGFLEVDPVEFDGGRLGRTHVSIWVSHMEARAACGAPRRAMCAASSKGQFNENAQSNQQDLIGEMETNRQQKTARGLGMLLGADGHARKRAIGQCCNRCLESRDERTADFAATRNQGAFGSLAAMCPVMRIIASARRALLMRNSVAVNWGVTKIALATVRMVRAVAHHQVDDKHCDAQDPRQCAHITPYSLSFVIDSKVSLSLVEVA